MQRLTKTLKVQSGSERHLIAWMRKLSDIIAGVPDVNNPLRHSLIKSLAIIQNENKIEEVKNAEKWIDELEAHLELLKKSLQKAKNEIEMLTKK